MVGVMKQESNKSYDRDTVKMMQTVLEEAWISLQPELRARSSKTFLATLILEDVAAGERDATQLRSKAVTRLAASTF